MCGSSSPLRGPRWGLFLIYLVLGFLGCNGASSASEGPWFGVAPPEEHEAGTEPLASLFADLGMAPLGQHLPAAMDRYRDIRGEEVHGHVRDFCQISEESRLAGDRLWGRIAGTRFERKAAELVRRELQSYGLKDVRVEDVPRSPQWWPLEWEVTLLGDPAYGDGTRDYVFTSAFPAEPSPSTPERGLEAELVYVGLGRPVDLVGRDLKGKIAVLLSRVAQSTFAHSGRGVPPSLVEAGAVGVLTLVNTPGNLLFKLQGTGAPPVPAFTLGGEDGAFLEEVLARAGNDHRLRARLRLVAETREGWETQNTLGLLPGRGDEYVVLSAHLDAYFQGASDNASGLATLLALARHFAAREEPLRRNLLFVATGGHHAGSVGVQHVVDHYPEVLKKTVFDLNCEHTSAILVRSNDGRSLTTANTESPKSVGITNASPRLTELLSTALDRYGVVVNSRVTTRAPGDAGRFARNGTPVVQLIESNYWYHSSGDTPETLTPRGLERTARAFAHFLDAVDKVSRDELEAGAVGMSSR